MCNYLKNIIIICLLLGCSTEEEVSTPSAGMATNTTVMTADMNAGNASSMMEATVSPTPCGGYCAYLENCGSCLEDSAGVCLEQTECEALCEMEVPAIAAECVSQLTSCNDGRFTECYDRTVPETDCGNACRFLIECGECVVNEARECLSLAGCSEVCERDTPPQAAQCLATQTDCSQISACFQ